MRSAKIQGDGTRIHRVSKPFRQNVIGSALCSLALLAAFVFASANLAHAQREMVLWSFGNPNIGDGSGPEGDMTIDANGNFYGTNYDGGSGYGTVFKFTPLGETVPPLYTFTGGVDGGLPKDNNVALDKAGNIYGTTYIGGAYNFGVVFKLTPTGTESVLHSFVLDGVDGQYPSGNIVLDSSGNIYGTTYSGGSGNCGGQGCGVVFKVSPSGTETILHAFTGGTTDGCNPFAVGLFLGPNKILYGATPGCGAYGYGTVYAITLSGKEKTLRNFNFGSGKGVAPSAGVIVDKSGNIYGTTIYGGDIFNCGQQLGCGTVFKLTPAGAETVLHSFSANGIDGYSPQLETLALDSLGNLYGTTKAGGANGVGIAFQISPSGKETILYNFGAGVTDAAYPNGLVFGRDHTLFGTSYGGGSLGAGTVFKLIP